MQTLFKTGLMKFFEQYREPNAFLSRIFTFKPGNFYEGDKVEIDVEREGEEVATVITKFTGPNLNEASEFVTKEFIPPSYGEAVALNVSDLLKRMAGDGAYQNKKKYSVDLLTRMMKGFKKIDRKIKRAIELQASQILQTGKLNLKDKDGGVAYELDYKPKTSHFPSVSVAWSTATADILGDLESLMDVIRVDGKVDCDMAIIGKVALRNMLKNESVQNALDNRRIDVGMIRPEMKDSGAVFYGFLWVGTYKIELWTYNDSYTDPETKLSVNYIDDNNVVLMSSRTRFDKVGARVPLPIATDPRVEGLLPGRLSSKKEGFDVTPNVYATTNGKQVMGELETRTLLVPVQIDGFGCITTTI